MTSKESNVNFNIRLKFQIFLKIYKALNWKQWIPFLFRFQKQKYNVQHSEIFSGSDFAIENRERFKLQVNLISLYGALRETLGDEKALFVMVDLIRTHLSESFMETIHLLSKLGKS